MSESFSLSPSQTRILLAELNFKGTKAYYLYAKTCFPIDDIERVKQAIPYIFSGNLNLRIRRGGSEGFEQYYSEEPPVFEEVDATGSDLKEVIEKYKKERIDTLFDAPLYKIYLIRHEDRVILFAVLHHLISDGTTIQKILPALFSDYISRLKKNEPCENLPVTYDRFITRVRKYLQTDESVEDREYWSESLSGYRGVGYMTDSLRKGTYALELSKSVTEKLKGFREENRISPFVLGLGASFVYFAGLKDKLGSRWSDMVWEISVHGRYFGDDLKDEIGMYVETIPLRLSFDRDISFTECLKRIKSVMKEGLSHAKTGTNEYFGELQKKGVDLRAITSFSVVSNSVSEGDGDLLMPDETDVPFHIRVNLNKKDEDGLQVLIIEYNRDIFTSKDIDGISRGIEGVLDAASDNPGILLSDIDYANSDFISSECLVEKNIAVAEEPVSLQCGMNRDSATDAPERTIETVRDRRIHEEARGMAALLAAITRFGMTKDVLVGIRVPSKKTVTRIFPFGMHIDTYLQTDQFIDAVREHIEEVRESSDYPIECRTDLKFAPSIVVSFTEKVSVTDQICISVCINRDGLSIDYDADRYSKEYVRGLISAVKSLYDEMSPVQAIRDIKLVKEKSVERKIELKNAGTVDRVLHDRVEEAPDKEILIACDRTLTYRELDEESNKVANALISGNIKPGDRILILMRRTSVYSVYRKQELSS